MKLFKRDINQTGVAIIKIKNGSEKEVPLYSLTPNEEIKSLLPYIKDVQSYSIYLSNNMMDYRIETCIKEFEERNGFIPEDMLDELVSGFPYVMGTEPGFNKRYYK